MYLLSFFIKDKSCHMW